MSSTSLSSTRGRLLATFSRFLGVGAVGFVVDAAVFFCVTQLLHQHYVTGRVAASFIAILVTWALNRRFTFAAGRHQPLQEFLRYFGASLIGAAANLAVLSLIAPFDAALAHVPAYVAGTAAGLVANFALYQWVVFRRG
jgi:putative flippase GtrA